MAKQVHTSIDNETARIAAIHNIGWASALRIGIEVLSGVSNDKQELLNKIENKKMEIKILENELTKLEKAEKEQKEKETKRVVVNG